MSIPQEAGYGGAVTAPDNLRPPRLIATDLDGTLVRRDGTISARTRSAVLAAQHAGSVFVMVTARPPRGFKRCRRDHVDGAHQRPDRA